MPTAIDITPPPSGTYAWRIGYRLEGVSGSLEWRWNPAHQTWTIDTFDAQGNRLFGPIPLAPGDDLWAGWRHFDIPPGSLSVVFAGEKPGLRDFDSAARLVYVTST